MAEEFEAVRGVIMNDRTGNAGLFARIFGVILIILGSMDCMLAWRGSYQINEFYMILIGFGMVLFCFGAVRASGSSKEA